MDLYGSLWIFMEHGIVLRSCISILIVDDGTCVVIYWRQSTGFLCGQDSSAYTLPWCFLTVKTHRQNITKPMAPSANAVTPETIAHHLEGQRCKRVPLLLVIKIKGNCLTLLLSRKKNIPLLPKPSQKKDPNMRTGQKETTA